ncbi:MAG: hypothetical protein ACE5KM_07630, partial [Planctomycetaceae bacterium]
FRQVASMQIADAFEVRREFTALLRKQRADVAVFETCTAAGDLCDELDQLGSVVTVCGARGRG